MLARLALAFIALSVFASCASKPSATTATKNAVMQLLPDGAFQVVLAKPPESKITYTRPLPTAKNDDGYWVVGWAFATGPNEFAAPAHIFSLATRGPSSDYALRDRDGQIHKIAQVTKFSMPRDLMTFTLGDTWKHIVVDALDFGDRKVLAKELAQLSTTKAEFALSKLHLARQDVVGRTSWSFEPKLPDTIENLAEAARANLLKTANSTFDDLYKTGDKRFFPANADWLKYARHQDVQPGFSIVAAPTKSQGWDFEDSKLTHIDLGGQAIDLTTSHSGTFFFLDAPSTLTVDQFVNDPRTIFEKANRVFNLKRSYYGEDVPVSSIGDPDHTREWKDDLGRTWHEAQWFAKPLDLLFEMNCAPTPRGVVCALWSVPLQIETLGGVTEMKKILNQVLWSEDGTLAQWQAFAKKNVELKDSKLTARFNGRTLVFPQASDKAQLTVLTRFAPVEKLKLETHAIIVQTEKGKFAKYWDLELHKLDPQDIRIVGRKVGGVTEVFECSKASKADCAEFAKAN